MEPIFVVNEDQRAILETVTRFVEQEVRPRAARLDANPDPAEGFSWEIVEKAHELGIRTMTLSEQWGGLGTDSLTTAMVIEELAKGDIGVSVIFAQTLKIAQIMGKALNAEQQGRVLPKFSSDPRGMLAIGITEPDTASNYFLPYPAPFRTSAQRASGGWIVNGMKHFISNGNRASFYLLFAQTEPGKPLAEGSTCFLLERGRPGFTIGRVHDKMGERLANNAELVFQDCFIPNENVVGEPGKGFQVMAQFFPQSNAYAGATILGVAVALHRKAIEWAQVRVQGGKPLIEHDGIRAQLAEMRMLIDASRSYIHRACWLADHQEHGWDKTLGALPKAMAAQAAWKIATWTMEIHGGHGYMKEVGIEKLVRDAAAFLHSDGVNRTLFLKAANFMFRD
ncbi:MAG: acyl-CoA/acyl-ACP dehydrogenase [Betaproteobacteria bacterium]|nr:acyl-CoA/acyl-ACP dehydrogenase [Gammaproteobacteria bacterium]MDH3438932.1 acyl-CoA/acyl-ACP dehydrogenase [Betaproteobacteria bacterium]